MKPNRILPRLVLPGKPWVVLAISMLICGRMLVPSPALGACPCLSSGIAAGAVNTLAVSSNGTVWVWGDHGYFNTDDASTTPIMKIGVSNVVAVAACHDTRYALKSDGTIWAWGNGNVGQLGDGTTNAWRKTPLQTSGLVDMVAVAAGDFFALGLRSDGTVWSWGQDELCALSYYPLGVECHCQTTPRQISGLTGMVAIAAGSNHGLAIRSGGTIWAWGSDKYGELGYDTIINNFECAPRQINGLDEVKQVQAGLYLSIALKCDGTVWSWGYNSNGQLGDGSTTNRTSPGLVAGLAGVAAVATGHFARHTLAVKYDGTVWAWGANEAGQLGDGTTTDRHTPVQVPALDGVIAVAAASYQSFAVKGDGTVWAWGDNSTGELGNGTLIDSHTPVQVSQATGLTDVSGPFVWLDLNYTGNRNGTFTKPYNSLSTAIAAVPIPCGILFIKPGHTNATPTIGKSMRVEAYGGPVKIGQ